MKTNILVFLFVFLISLSAFPQGRGGRFVYKSAFELNQSAILLFQNFSYSEDSVKKALRMLNDAIYTDSTYYIAYMNKVSLLCALGLNDELLKELDEVVNLYRRDPQLICMEAYVLERAGQKEEAMVKYKEADVMYDDLIKSNQNILYNKIGKAFLQLFLKGKKEGIRRYNDLYHDNKDKVVVYMRNAFINFNRQEFIKNYCIPPQPLPADAELVSTRAK